MTLTLLAVILATLIVSIPAYIDHKKQIGRSRTKRRFEAG